MSGPAVATHGEMICELDALDRWGEALGASLAAPALVTLRGDLGTGKTTLARAICRGLGVTEAVTSPTFAIVHQHSGTRGRVFHLDLYRIASPRELVHIAWDETVGSNAVTLVEWPDRAGTALPVPDVAIALSHIPGDPGRRRLVW